MMRVAVGYSDNPDTMAAGIQAAKEAMARSGHGARTPPCDLVLLFSTSRHDSVLLGKAVRSIVGQRARIVGGGAVGAMTNDRYGYAGDQIGLAAFWLEGAGCDILAEGGLNKGEEAVGAKLGEALLKNGAGAESPVMLFYDSVDRTRGDVRLIAATELLAGMRRSMNGLPRHLVGAGLLGDFACSPTTQWIGSDLVQHHAMALAFSEEVRLDSVILHGCRPATGYYTVTKAEKQVILEINHEPALRFLQKLLGPSIPPEEYVFFLIFGINKGDKWGEFDENKYASRLCLAIDKQREGIVMVEPDMVEGTRFQIMHRSLDLDYMSPRIAGLFDRLGDREPVFAFYIDCAGRAAGYAGTNLEDALVVQNATAGKVPLLGIYSGVEIASVADTPRALDWTGVFCLLSVKA